MTIRYQCPECDSVLKIKDSLAGTDGKCPKCKTKFVVPEPQADQAGHPNDSETDQTSAPAAKSKSSKSAAKPQKQKAAATGGDDDDFDPAAFLMEDGPGPKASAGLTEQPKEEGPATDSKGRRLYTQSGASKAKAASMSAAAAAADSQLNASANARDLLTKNMDESRVRAATMPMPEKEPVFDFSGAAQELKRYAPHAVGAVVLIVGLYMMVDRMFREGIDLPPLGKVSGTVMVDGDPLVGVGVNFTPLDDVKQEPGDGPKRIRTATGFTDENGYYTLSYVDGVKGAPVGKGRLWLEARSAADVKKIPPEWGQGGPNIREVKKAGNNADGEFNITATTKK